MELAVTVMRNSIHERRGDGKENPLVGAVLWRPDGAVESASRGELRSFATLEPCAPGARKHPKLSCPERIVLARVREVWAGIGDPDPSAGRKGIRYLQENGISVRMFDADLREAIRKANREFLRQAVQRAEKARPAGGTAAALMPDIEGPSRPYGMEDLSHLGILKAETVTRQGDVPARRLGRPAGSIPRFDDIAECVRRGRGAAAKGAGTLSNHEQAGWQVLASMTAVAKSRYAEHSRFDGRKAQRH